MSPSPDPRPLHQAPKMTDAAQAPDPSPQGPWGPWLRQGLKVWAFSALGLLALTALAWATGLGAEAWAQAAPPVGTPGAREVSSALNSVDLRSPLQSPGLSTPLQIIFLSAALTMLPLIFIATTSFVRTIIVLIFFKNALSSQNLVPGNVLVAIAVFLSLYVMGPTWEQINQRSILPFLNNRISQEQAVQQAALPMVEFMARQVHPQELSLFLRMAKVPDPAKPTDVPFYVMCPAFLVSEVATGFKIGFLVFLPFLVIDLVISNILTALGMQQGLQVQQVAPPFKILIFSLADGWHLLVEAIVRSFGVH